MVDKLLKINNKDVKIHIISENKSLQHKTIPLHIQSTKKTVIFIKIENEKNYNQM